MNRQRAVYAAKVGAIAAVYYGAAKLGLDLAFATPSVTAVWPPTGIALAALVLLGPRLWPGVALGAFLANAWTGVPLLTVLGITTGNTLEALVGALLLARVGFRPSLERVRDVVALFVLAGALSTLVSATIGTTSLLAGDEIAGADYGSVWRTWWLGDMGGVLLVAPAIMVGLTHWPYRRAPGGALEAVLLVLSLGAVAGFVFSQEISLTYLIFPSLIWAAFRFWQPGAAFASLLVAAIAIPLTERDLGPFAGESPDDRLLLAQTFVGAAAVSTMVLAAVITERRRAEQAVERIAETLQESLLPSRLPEIPGVEIAADFRPAGLDNLVGGDFYDLFANDDGTWAVVIGDVCGKGPRAAALTGLTRYTVRAAAARESSPSRILEQLGKAILRESPNEFATVVLARLDVRGAGTDVVLSCAGHPRPLLRRAGGDVQQLSLPGTLLGVVPDAHLSDRDIRLAPGDALVLYTDGVTDARAPSRILTPGDLAAAIAEDGDETAAGILGRVRDVAFRAEDGEPRDDAAVLVLRAIPAAPA